RLVSENKPSAAFCSLRKDARLDDPYIVVQASYGLEKFVEFAKKHSRWLSAYKFLVLPVSPGLQDSISILGDELPGRVSLSSWPDPLLLAELIAHAEAVVGLSYHLAITALAFGVPVFTPADRSEGKYSALKSFDTIYDLPDATVEGRDLFLARLGIT